MFSEETITARLDLPSLGTDHDIRYNVSAQNESGPLPKVVAKYIFANRRGPLLLHGFAMKVNI